jgi:hypothetical protein
LLALRKLGHLLNNDTDTFVAHKLARACFALDLAFALAESGGIVDVLAALRFGFGSRFWSRSIAAVTSYLRIICANAWALVRQDTITLADRIFNKLVLTVYIFGFRTRLRSYAYALIALYLTVTWYHIVRLSISVCTYAFEGGLAIASL